MSIPAWTSRIARSARTCAIAVFFALAAAATAQPNVSHGAAVEIPATYGIRIVDATGRPAALPEVHFDYAGDPTGYLAAVASPGAETPTAVVNFADVEVSVAGGFGIPLWEVQVSATPFSYAGPSAPAGLAVSDIWVDRGASSGLSPRLIPFWGRGIFWAVANSWRLDTAPTTIAVGLIGTAGWRSLGFNGQDYRIDLQADEAPGSYTTIVTYTLMAP